MDTEDEPVFGGLDEQPIKCQPAKIQLTKNAQPYSVSTAGRVPTPPLGKVKERLTRSQKIGVIEKILPVQKKSGGVRPGTDLRD